MIGAKLRARLQAGERILMTNPHHVSTGLVARLCELGSDTVFLDCEHGSAGFEEVREMARAARSAGGGAIVRPDSHQRSLLIRYLNAGADGLMVPLVNTADAARHIVETVRYACPADHQDRLVVVMIETTEAIANLDAILAVEGIDVFFLGPGDLSQSMGYLPTVPRGQKRPQPVLDAVENAIARIRKSGRIAGTLVTEDDIALYAGLGTGFFYLHSDPFLRTGLEMMRQRAG
ncbi:MAG: 2,4-dihydroxyhept-2-ene-1,7-dioic acid aldolase [Alphaproteobacteria bacterium]|nr:2,4-dihydroxyhept-2-ene-1,7-dioic acid aldolase [Alphaproteobacteria bacterium]